MKQCKKCGEVKLLNDFYTHPEMADGYLNTCKACFCEECKARRVRNRDKLLLYDRMRYDQHPHRKEAIAQRIKNLSPEQRHELNKARSKNHRNRYPERTKARQAISNAIRDGRIFRQPCEVCGTTERVEAHHEDYSKPFDVRWLCVKHHTETRRKPRNLPL